MKKKKYAVYFSQVNQLRIEVEASGPLEAQKKATREWRAIVKEPAHVRTECLSYEMPPPFLPTGGRGERLEGDLSALAKQKGNNMSETATNSTETGGQVHPIVIPGESERQGIIKHLSDELEFAEIMILKHKSENHPEAAKVRQAHAEKLTGWIKWLSWAGGRGITTSYAASPH